jgi:hypothetical protein
MKLMSVALSDVDAMIEEIVAAPSALKDAPMTVV